MKPTNSIRSGSCRFRVILSLLLLWSSALGLVAQVAEAPHCHGIVQKIVQPNGIVTYQLICEGECPDGGKCERRQSQNHHGGVREWCSCGEEEPPHCHIVLYTPGRGEGGGKQQVFCAGQCPDGQPCRLHEQLVREVDGIQVFHLVCACEGEHGHPDDQPGDDEKPTDPSDQDDPGQDNPDEDTPSNPDNGPDAGDDEPIPGEDDNANPNPDGSTQDNDDSCCGDDDKKACKGIVQKIIQPNGIVTYQLLCDGDCPDRAKCETRKSRNHHGGVREWCGCSDTEPSTCHIVIYTHGDSEPGKGQEVFCAGACPDGTPCKLQEKLVRVVNGFRFFHLSCDCDKPAGGGDGDASDDDSTPDDNTQPGDDEPNNSDDEPSNDDAGSSNTNDDACCGDDAPGAAKPCKGYVQKVVQNNGRVTYQLVCGGDCPGRAKCEPRGSRNHHGGVRQWCGCDDKEPSGCHIVLYTPGPGEGGAAQEVFCAGACPDGSKCTIKEVLKLKTDDGNKIYHITCDCGKPAGGGGDEDSSDGDTPDDPTQPGDDEPNDNGSNDQPNNDDDDDADASNTNDDACCGDDAPGAAKPCKGYVQKVVQNNGRVTYQLACGGDCPGRAKCEPRSSRNHHGGVRQWCGCDDKEPSGCHIVLYTPGPGEGGGAQKVFCAGACPDGSKCAIKEVLKLKTDDGSKIYHITCDCGKPADGGDNDNEPSDDDTTPDDPTQPGDDEPNDGDDEPNNDDTDANSTNGNDDACCGDDAPGAAKPCKGYVQKIVQSNGIVTYQLICGGDCPGRAKCEPRSSRNHHGGVRQWCGCNRVEPSTCHIVLYTPGRGEGGGAQKVFCAGACPDGSKCAIKTVLVHRTARGTKVFRITCDCKKKAADGAGVGAVPNDIDPGNSTSETAFITELDPDFILEVDQDSRSKLNELQAITTDMKLQTESVPFQGEKFYQLTFDGVPESLYEVLVSDDMQQWQRAGTAEEIEPGRYGWVDEEIVDHAPRFYTLKPLYVAKEEDLNDER